MAMRRILLAAHDRHAVLLCTAFETLDRLLEPLLLGNLPVEDVTVGVVELVTVRPAAELLAKEEIPNACLSHELRQHRRIDPRDITGVRPGSDIDEYLDPVFGQEPPEMI
jgi:hypothetical protein